MINGQRWYITAKIKHKTNGICKTKKNVLCGFLSTHFHISLLTSPTPQMTIWNFMAIVHALLRWKEGGGEANYFWVLCTTGAVTASNTGCYLAVTRQWLSIVGCAGPVSCFTCAVKYFPTSLQLNLCETRTQQRVLGTTLFLLRRYLVPQTHYSIVTF
jgi:hypothetical protein